MIKEIIVSDFFSFKGEHHIKLKSRVNILLGINGSGKTSFLRTLEFLYESVCGIGLNNLIAKWGLFATIHNFSTGNNSDSFKIAYVFDKDVLNGVAGYTFFEKDVKYSIAVKPVGLGQNYILNESLTSDDGELIYFEFNNGTGRLNILGKDQKSQPVESLSTFELVLHQIKDPVHYSYIDYIQKAIGTLSLYSIFDVSSDSEVRRPEKMPVTERLNRKGTNIAILLSTLKNNDYASFSAINKSISDVNRVYSELDTAYNAGTLSLVLREKGLDMAIDSQHISDGTLQFILMSSIFLNKARGFVVGMDEPERGLHPDMIVSIADMIKKASKTSQIVIATHSPLLLNEFSLDDILVFEKSSDDNSTQVSMLDSDDFDEDALPGQLWLDGQIGGKRW